MFSKKSCLNWELPHVDNEEAAHARGGHHEGSVELPVQLRHSRLSHIPGRGISLAIQFQTLPSVVHLA